jgi:hypothetical protein
VPLWKYDALDGTSSPWGLFILSAYFSPPENQRVLQAKQAAPRRPLNQNFNSVIESMPELK